MQKQGNDLNGESVYACHNFFTMTAGILARSLANFNCQNPDRLKIYEMLSISVLLIPLTNRVRGPYGKLRILVFSSSIYGPSAKRAGHKSKGKKRGSVTYSTDRENEVSKIFIISLVCVRGAEERFLFTRNGFKFLTHLESKTSQFEIVFLVVSTLQYII